MITQQPMCVILIGPPCSGKSHSREILMGEFAKLGRTPVVISSDDIVEAVARDHGCTYSEAFSKVDMKSMDRSLSELLGRAIQNGDDIIVDRTNMSRKTRNRVLARLSKNYYRLGIDVKVSWDVLCERLRIRALTGKVISLEIVKDMMTRYEEPTLLEFDRVLKIDNE